MKSRKRFWIGYKDRKDFNTLFLDFSETYPEVLNESGTEIYISTMDTYIKMVENCVNKGEINTEFYQRFKSIKKDYDDLMSAEY